MNVSTDVELSQADPSPRDRDDLDPSIDDAVRAINEMAGSGGIDLARTVGSFVLREFFGGDHEPFADAQGEGSRRFRRLIDHPGLDLPATAVYTFVRVARQLEQLPDDVGRRLSVSHHRALLALEPGTLKTRLAERAVEESWSKAELERRIRKVTPPSQRGRKRQPACVRAAPKIAQALDEALDERVSLDELASAGSRRLLDTLSQLDESLVRLQWLQATVQQALERAQEP